MYLFIYVFEGGGGRRGQLHVPAALAWRPLFDLNMS